MSVQSCTVLYCLYCTVCTVLHLAGVPGRPWNDLHAGLVHGGAGCLAGLVLRGAEPEQVLNTDAGADTAHYYYYYRGHLLPLHLLLEPGLGSALPGLALGRGEGGEAEQQHGGDTGHPHLYTAAGTEERRGQCDMK